MSVRHDSSPDQVPSGCACVRGPGSMAEKAAGIGSGS